MRISTRIKLIENQIKALKNKKRILTESIKPMAPEPPRLTPTHAAANKIYRWARKSGINKLTLELYIFMSDNAQTYIPEVLQFSYDEGQLDQVYDDIWDIITYSSSGMWEKLEAQMGPEAAFDKVLELVFKGFTKIQNIGDAEFGTFEYDESLADDEEYNEEYNADFEDFWKEVSNILCRMWNEG